MSRAGPPVILVLLSLVVFCARSVRSAVGRIEWGSGSGGSGSGGAGTGAAQRCRGTVAAVVAVVAWIGFGRGAVVCVVGRSTATEARAAARHRRSHRRWRRRRWWRRRRRRDRKATFDPIAPGTITGTAVFTRVTSGIQVVVTPRELSGWRSPIHIHEGPFAPAPPLKGALGGDQRSGRTSDPTGARSPRQLDAGTLTYMRPNTPARRRGPSGAAPPPTWSATPWSCTARRS